MDLDLTGKNALVCGSSQGIGKAIALELAGIGANVTLIARNEDKLKAVLDLLPANNQQQHTYIVADFMNIVDLKTKVDQLVEKQAIHILINNSGGPPAGPITEARPEAFLKALHQHLIVSHLLVQSCLSGMKESAYGRIINIISTSVKQPIAGLGVSNTTRGAMANWSKTMANELGPFGITVNNILPGATDTDRLKSIIQRYADKAGISYTEQEDKMKATIPLRRIGRPEEIAAAAAFLASPAASYITGTNLTVDGGRTKSL